jgi:plastocyanin
MVPALSTSEVKMKRCLPAAAVLLAAALLVAACSGAADTTTTAGPTTSAAGGGFEVVMESFAFTPAEITVPVGATVTWVNRHGARHDVVAADGSFASPLFGQGETFSFTFAAPGEYPYVCSIHPGMEGTVIVTP